MFGPGPCDLKSTPWKFSFVGDVVGDGRVMCIMEAMHSFRFFWGLVAYCVKASRRPPRPGEARPAEAEKTSKGRKGMDGRGGRQRQRQEEGTVSGGLGLRLRIHDL